MRGEKTTQDSCQLQVAIFHPSTFGYWKDTQAKQNEKVLIEIAAIWARKPAKHNN